MTHAETLRLALRRAADVLEDLARMARSAGMQLVAAHATGAAASAQEALEATKPTARELFNTQAEPAASLPSLHFVIPTPPSSKNAKALRVVNGRPMMFRPREILEATEQIQEAACEALRRQAPTCYRARRPLLEDEDVQVEMTHNVVNETCDVMVRGMGPRPKGRTGRRRDVVNIPELVLDAMQRIAFSNDNQVADLRVWRNVGVPTTER